MTILGIDPGTARVGWGVIQIINNKPIYISCGCITTDPQKKLEFRLVDIHTDVTTLITEFKPDIVSIEELFFATNAKTAIAVGQARGVILLTATQHQTPVISYTPLAVKRAICGYGQADKTQIQKMVTKILKLHQIPKPDDAADALAIALTHAYSGKMKQIL